QSHHLPTPTILLSPLTPPTRPTLLPYTTLFRSRDRQEPENDQERVDRQQVAHVHERLIPRQTIGAPYEKDRQQECPAILPDPELDRKSTRLNSSHEWISYAVFCLKKNNNNQLVA